MIHLESLEDAVVLAKNIGFNFKVHDDMDVSIEEVGYSGFIIVPRAEALERLAALMHNYSAEEFVILARTEAPPLYEFDLPPGLDPQIRQLCECRYGVIHGESKLLELIEILLERGGSVVNDIYFFPPGGGFLGHVSHHDEVLIYVMKA